MATINEVVSKDVQGQIDKLIQQLEKVYGKIGEINKVGLDLYGGGQSGNTTELNNLINSYSKLSAEQSKVSKQVIDLAIKEERLAQAQNRTNISNNSLEKSTISLEKARDNAAKAQDREMKKLEAASSLYNQTQQKMNSLIKTYNDLAIKKALNQNLSDKEEKDLKDLQLEINKYNTALKGVDATIGKHQREVGNYALKNNALSGSINQLTREMPAFANSAQTGFMAISNNLPIFFDAISNTRKQIKELQADGQKVPSLFSQLTSSIFSWGTALSVGVTLLTVYGKEIGNFAKELIQGAKGLDAVAESTKLINESRIKGTKAAQDELISMRANLEIAKDVNLSYKERNIAVDNLIKQYPFYFEGLTREQILAGQTAKAEKELTNAILSRAKAQAATEKITENQSKIIDLEEKQLQLKKDLTAAEINQARAIQYAKQAEGQRGEAAAFGVSSAISAVASARKRLTDNQKEINTLQDISNRLTSYALENQKQAIGLNYQEEKSKEKVINKKREENEVYKIGTEKWLTEQISKLEELRSKQADSTEEYKNSTGAIKFYQFWLENLRGSQDKLNESQEKSTKIGTVDYYNQIISKLKEQQAATADNIAEYEIFQKKIDLYQTLLDNLTGNTKKTGDEAKKQLKEVKSYLESFIDSFAGQSGFPTIFKILRNEIKGFGKDATTTLLAVSEAFQEMYNFLNQGSEERFRSELERNEQQKNIAIKFAGESSTAKEEIERQYEEKRKEIQRKQAQAAKEAALFNAIINTAQAVVAALPNVPLSVAIGVIGAAQAALIAARPLPEFWTGTDNAPEGLAKTQERGREIITDRNNNIKSWGSDKGTRIDYLKKGDKVINAENTKKIIDQAMFMESLNGLLLENTIGTIPFKVEQKNDNSGVISEIKALRNDFANSQSSLIITRDKRGERTFEYKNGVKRELLNNSLKGIAKYVK